MVEAPFELLEEQVEVRLGDGVVSTQVAFGLAPEALDTIDVVASADELLGVVDALVVELRDVKRVMRGEAIGVDDAVGAHALTNDAEQRQ